MRKQDCYLHRKARIVVLLPLFCLSACGGPALFQVTSYAAGGVSMLTTGKSLSDHALSTAVGQDCALFNLVQEESLCGSYQQDDVIILLTDDQEFDQRLFSLKSP